jgi:hypothetical protein
MARQTAAQRATAAAAAAVAAAASGGPTPFSLTPAAAKTGILSFTDKEEVKIYERSSAKLSSDEFDCLEDQLMDFMTALKQRANEYGWNGMMTIAQDPNDATSRKLSILEEHGNLSMEAVKAHEDSYKDAKNRDRQNQVCLYKAIMATLSRVGRNKVATEREKYIFKNSSHEDVYSGNLLLKVVLTKTSVDNRSGAFSIRMELADLPRLMESVKYDVSRFNERVRALMDSLATRGEKSADLPFNLFQAFKEVPVPMFQVFIQRLKDDFDEDSSDKFTESYIMDKCENKFRNLTKEKEWAIEGRQEDKILALQAQIKRLEKKQGKKRGHKDTAKKPNKKKGKGTPGGKGEVDTDRKPRDPTKPVTIKGKQWWWCSKDTGGKCDGKLRRHNPKDCKGLAFLKKGEDADGNSLKKMKMGVYHNPASSKLAEQHEFYSGTEESDGSDSTTSN